MRFEHVNTALWDWSHLSLCDALHALMGEMRPEAYRAFYREAMEIARRATPYAP